MISFIQWLCPEITRNATRSCDNSRRITTLEKTTSKLKSQVRTLQAQLSNIFAKEQNTTSPTNDPLFLINELRRAEHRFQVKIDRLEHIYADTLRHQHSNTGSDNNQ